MGRLLQFYPVKHDLIALKFAGAAGPCRPDGVAYPIGFFDGGSHVGVAKKAGELAQPALLLLYHLRRASVLALTGHGVLFCGFLHCVSLSFAACSEIAAHLWFYLRF